SRPLELPDGLAQDIKPLPPDAPRCRPAKHTVRKRPRHPRRDSSLRFPLRSSPFTLIVTDDAADVPTLLRIVQSIPSPKAEPLKRWLAQVGHASGRSLLFCSSTSALVGGDGPAAWELRAQAGPATVAESG